MSEVVSEDISCESNVEGQKSSLDDCKKVFHKPRSDEDEGDLKFDPPVYRQRYQVVGEMVKKYNAKKVLDFGCAEGKLLKYLINHTSVEELTGVDIDGGLLAESKFRLQPLIADYLVRRPRPLKVSTYQGSIAEADKRFCDWELMACIEIIEHLEPTVLDAMPAVVFGSLTPKVVIVTTPNVEFNVLFPGLQGFRHWDHKFEWTRAEFEDWARQQATKYSYRVTFRGIGAGGEGTEHLGCVSQMALFERECCFDEERLSSMEEHYVLVSEVHFPHQSRVLSEEEKVLHEVEYLLWTLSCPAQTEVEEVALLESQHLDGWRFTLDRLMEFPGLKKVCGSTDQLRSILKSSGTYRLNDDESAVLWQRPESWSSDEAENEVDWDTNDDKQPNTCSNVSEDWEPECWDSDIQTHTWALTDFAPEVRTDEGPEEQEGERGEEELSEGDDCQYLSDSYSQDYDLDSSLVDEECDGDGLAWVEVTDDVPDPAPQTRDRFSGGT